MAEGGGESGGGVATKTRVAKKPTTNGTSGVIESSIIDPIPSPAQLLFARRLTKLEQVSTQLRHLYREYAQCLIAEKQHKANVYLNTDAKSHGEREGYASANSISLTTETLLLKGQIDSLVEERDFLKFAIEQDVGE